MSHDRCSVLPDAKRTLHVVLSFGMRLHARDAGQLHATTSKAWQSGQEGCMHACECCAPGMLGGPERSPLGLSKRSLALCRRPRACRGLLTRRTSSILLTYVLSSSSFLGEAGHHQLLDPRLPEFLCRDGLPEEAPAHIPAAGLNCQPWWVAGWSATSSIRASGRQRILQACNLLLCLT